MEGCYGLSLRILRENWKCYCVERLWIQNRPSLYFPVSQCPWSEFDRKFSLGMRKNPRPDNSKWDLPILPNYHEKSAPLDLIGPQSKIHRPLACLKFPRITRQSVKGMVSPTPGCPLPGREYEIKIWPACFHYPEDWAVGSLVVEVVGRVVGGSTVGLEEERGQGRAIFHQRFSNKGTAMSESSFISNNTTTWFFETVNHQSTTTPIAPSFRLYIQVGHSLCILPQVSSPQISLCRPSVTPCPSVCHAWDIMVPALRCLSYLF